MPRLPILTPELIWKLDNMHTLLDLDRLGGMAQLEGNPWSIEVKRFGRATAFTSPGIATHYYNKVLGLGVAELSLIDDVAAFFIRTGAPTCRIDILPGDMSPALAERLAAYGLRHADFQAGYYGFPECPDDPFAPGVTIRDVENDFDVAKFLEIFHIGWEMQPNTLAAFKHFMRYWYGLPGWHLYLACIEGTPRGVGVMFDHEGIGYLALATTLQEFRNRGAEKALIQYAIRHAKKLGCELMCGQCDFPSPTARNFQRFGMQLAYTKAMWLHAPQAAAGRAYREGDPSSLY